MYSALQLLINSTKFNDLFKKKRKTKRNYDETDLNNCETWNKKNKTESPTFPGKFIMEISSAPLKLTSTPFKTIESPSDDSIIDISAKLILREVNECEYVDCV